MIWILFFFLFGVFKHRKLFYMEYIFKTARNLFTAAPVAIVFVALMLSPASGMAAEEDNVVYLVRHAEKTDEGQDPELSSDGRQRSRELARMLKDAGIQHVHSTDFIRSRDTAAPLAALLGLEVELYSWDDPVTFARSLIDEGQRHLVVGHSNTTTELVTLLGGDPGTEIEHSGEYDRLYVLTIDSSGTATVALIRYGKPFTQ
jgi:broad specificity phosphatase PhoE